MKKLITLVMLLTLGLSLLVGCGSSDDTSSTDTTDTTATADDTADEAETVEVADLGNLNVAILPQYHGYMLQACEDQGFFEAFGITSTSIDVYAGGAPVNEALASDQWEISSLGGAAITSVCSYDARSVALSCGEGVAQYFYVANDSAILDVQGYNSEYPDMYGDPDTVAGMTIITTAGTTLYYDLLVYLDALGLTVDDVEILNMDPGPAVTAFLAGEGDMLITCPPYAWVIDADEYTRAFTVLDVGGDAINTIVASATALEENRDAVVAAVAAYMVEIDRAIADQEATLEEFEEFLLDNGYEPTYENLVDEYAKQILTIEEQIDYFTVVTDTGYTEAMNILLYNADFMLSTGAITQDQYDYYIENAVDATILEDAYDLMVELGYR